MDPQAIFEATKLVTAGGAAVFIVVQMVKAFGYTTPRATVAAAALFGAVLTALFAWSNALLEARYAFDLAIAAIGVAAAGAGISSAAKATTTNT